MDRRSYNQYCGLARSLDIVGERWTLLIVRNLLLGPLRYTDLMRGLPGITTNLLAKRLQEMEEIGIVERIHAAPSDRSHTYRLTPLGASLEPAVHALGRWGWNFMKDPKRTEYRSVDFLMVALRRRYLGGAHLTAELLLDGVPYRITLDGKKADVSRGEAIRPDLRLTGKGADVAKLFLDRAARKHLAASIELDGPQETFRELLGAFATEELTQ